MSAIQMPPEPVTYAPEPMPSNAPYPGQSSTGGAQAGAVVLITLILLQEWNTAHGEYMEGPDWINWAGAGDKGRIRNAGRVRSSECCSKVVYATQKQVERMEKAAEKIGYQTEDSAKRARRVRKSNRN
jgi:hypothetical protein